MAQGLDTSILAKRRDAIAAAEVLFDNPDAVPEFEPDDVDTAQAAVRCFERRFASLPGTITAVLERAKSGAESLSGNRLQGLSEIIQNADDAGATNVRVLLQPDALFIAHNGCPFCLRDVHALATPWITTKRDNDKALGRFGIGMMTLQALSSTLELHSGPYNVRFDASIVTAIEPFAIPDGFADADDTIFRIPFIDHSLDANSLIAWAKTWDDSALLFCNSVGRVTVHPGDSPIHSLALQWEEQTPGRVTIGGTDTSVRRRTAIAPDGRIWRVHTAEVPPPTGVDRTHKARGSTMPLGVAFALHDAEKGLFYAGLPLVSFAHAACINAQFDPLTNRHGLADTEWNAALGSLIADFWKAAVLELFETDPKVAWQAIPLAASLRQSGETGLVAQFEEMLVSYAQETLPGLVKIRVGETYLPLTHLAHEVPPLRPILSEQEIAELVTLPATLPFHTRDQKGRWRRVLESWRKSGAALTVPVSVRRALELFQRSGRSVQQTIALAAVALDENLKQELAQKPCVIIRDGSALRPPARNDPWMFVTSVVPLAQELGVAQVLHEAYSTDEQEVLKVREWLRSSGAINEANDTSSVLARLAAAGEDGKRLEQPLSDAQFQAIWDAFEDLTQKEREKLGPGVGRAIIIDGYQFDEEAKRLSIHDSPANMYLPSSMDSGSDSFAVAAGKTPGLRWVQARYATRLHPPAGRTGLSVQRFLQLLGAETAPRLAPPPHADLEWRFRGKPRGLGRHVGNLSARVNELSRIRATYTLNDHYSPDLIAVLTSISREEEAKQRQRRSLALLATIDRAWDRFFEASEVRAVNDYYGWQDRGTIKAFWIWQAMSIPWLDDADAQPTLPTTLRLQTSGTVAFYGSHAKGYLHKDLQQAQRVLELFGVTGDPKTSDLVKKLQALRKGDTDDRALLRRETSVLYQALAACLTNRGRASDDLSIPSLQRAFENDGLILTNLGWRPPSQVLRGDPIFGDYCAFTPSVPATEHLWPALQVQKPSAADCVAVLNEIARDSPQPTASQQTIVLETLRYLADEFSHKGPFLDSLKKDLASLPLWTGEAWTSTRPVYAVRDPLLDSGLRSQVAVWQHGGDLNQFTSLLEPLRLTELSLESAHVLPSRDIINDEEATMWLRKAVSQLHEDFARNDPDTYNSLRRISWDQLAQFDVRVVPKLHVEIADIPNQGSLTVPVPAITDLSTSTLYVTNAQSLMEVEAGGQAIAGLFTTTDRRRVAQAWLVACYSASSGRESLQLELASDRKKKEEDQWAADIAQLEAFRDETQSLHNQSGEVSAEHSPSMMPTPVSADISTSISSNQQIVPERSLIDPNHYRLMDARGSVTEAANGVEARGASTGSEEPDGRTMPKALPTPSATSMPPHEYAGPRSYTERTKESIGFELFRKLFASDQQTIRDLRAQYGLGADAVDEHNRFFELKVHAGAEPDEVRLEGSQIHRARSTSNFFLVVVSDVEEREGVSPKVRIIINPLAHLSIAESSSVTFKGIRSSRSVVYQFKYDSFQEESISE